MTASQSGSETSAASAAKAAIRRRLRVRRRERLGLRDVEAEAEALADAVLDLVARQTDGRVCVVAAYESRATEPPTHRLVERLAAAGHRVLVPVTLSDLDLDWREPGPDDAARSGAYRGMEAISEAEVVVVPALAVDRFGHRLGQGGGSYDRALARRRPDAVLVALLHDEELLDAGEVPVDLHDVAVQVVVTPSRGAVSLNPPV